MLSVVTLQVPVESSTKLHFPRRVGKVKPVAKDATASPAKSDLDVSTPPVKSDPDVSTPPAKSDSAVSTPPAKSVLPAVSTPPAVSPLQASKKTPVKPPPRANTKPVIVKEKPQQFRTKITAGIPPKATVSPRKICSPKIIAFGRSLTNPVPRTDFRRKNSISGGNDFKVTNSAYKPTMSTIFSYDLSPLERNDYGICDKNPMNPMKSVPHTEVQLLQSGQRSSYLEKRYEHAPDAKYNYPEATSMRYGWFHRLGDPFQKRVPRKN